MQPRIFTFLMACLTSVKASYSLIAFCDLHFSRRLASHSCEQMFPLQPLPEMTGLTEIKFTVHRSSSSLHTVERARETGRRIETENERETAGEGGRGVDRARETSMKLMSKHCYAAKRSVQGQSCKENCQVSCQYVRVSACNICVRHYHEPRDSSMEQQHHGATLSL